MKNILDKKRKVKKDESSLKTFTTEDVKMRSGVIPTDLQPEPTEFEKSAEEQLQDWMFE